MPEPQYRKKLIEVALPLDAINSAASKSIRSQNPQNIHYWWAHRPLVACRAILFASLVDDPSAHPEIFQTKAAQESERRRLFSIIENLVDWKQTKNEALIFAAQKEIARSINSTQYNEISKDIESVRRFIQQYAPPVIDPFCGGGSIPIEAQRLGLDTFAIDLNPIPVLITKSLIELPHNLINQPPINPESRKEKKLNNSCIGLTGLVEDLEYYGKWIGEEAERRIGHFYPKISITKEITAERPDLNSLLGKDLPIISWIWARTVKSPDPSLKGVHVPLIKSFWLSKKNGKEAWIEPIIDKEKNTIQYKIHRGKPPSGVDPAQGTVIKGSGPKCLISNQPISFEYIKKEGKSGKIGAILLAVVAQGVKEKIYLPASNEQRDISQLVNPENYPITNIPLKALGFRIQAYGIDNHYKMYTKRQLLALVTFCDILRETHQKIINDFHTSNSDKSNEYIQNRANALITYLSFPIGRAADYWSSLATWHNSNQQIRNTFSKQTIQMTWDYAEANPFSDSTGSWKSLLSTTIEAVKGIPPVFNIGHCNQYNSAETIGNVKDVLCSTDPPYYANIGYADLSDVFYIWLRQCLQDVYPSLFATVLSPKNQELIASPHRHGEDKEKAKLFFEEGLERAFKKICAAQQKEYPITVFYAFKQTELEKDRNLPRNQTSINLSTGWETILKSLINSGLSIVGTWPIKSEPYHRMRAHESNTLESSVVLVCRPKLTDSPLATRREFITTLKQKLPDALRTLQVSNIAPVDLAQAIIGPGMEIFTKYSRIVEVDGSTMTVRAALGLINQTLDEILTEQEGDFDSDTRWAVSWFDQYGMGEGPFGDAEILSKAKNTAINSLAEDGLITARGGKVQLVARGNLQKDWDPSKDKRLTVWEATHHLIRALEEEGESGAEILLRKLGGGMGEAARDLAYRLYSICDRKKWSQEALGYNSLIVAWPEITSLAQSAARLERAQRMITGEE